MVQVTRPKGPPAQRKTFIRENEGAGGVAQLVRAADS